MKAIPEYPGYFVTEDGSVYSNRQGKPKKLKTNTDTKGYVTFNCSYGNTTKVLRVHREVLKAFVGEPPNGCVACHNNGNKLDNRLENLRWDSRRNNELDKLKHETLRTQKLTEQDAKDIKWMLQQKRFTQAEIGDMFGVHCSNVSAISRGKSWSHIT